MSPFLLALIAVFLTSLGARDQMLVASLSCRLGRHFGLLFIGCLIAVLTAIIMALAGHYVAGLLPADGKSMLVALALVLAAIELAWPISRPAPGEPTRSLGAIGLVLLIRQWSDAGRFLIFALAAATNLPWHAATGGGIGGIAAIVLGWTMAEKLGRMLPLRAIRLSLSVATICSAAYIGLTARGLLG